MTLRTVAFTPLHYGKHYLKWAVEAVAPFVDKHIILYTSQPSYCYECNQVPGAVCPDTEEELRACVEGFSHVEWHSGRWNSESTHRMEVYKYVDKENTDILLPVDADEVWHPYALQECLEKLKEHPPINLWRVKGFQHLWRSFFWRCTDVLAPVRIIDLRTNSGDWSIDGKVFHFGYAETFDVMRYKWSVHGHQTELRPGWLEEKYIGWEPRIGDVHPTNEKDWWMPKNWIPSDMPRLLDDHPYHPRQMPQGLIS